MSSIINSDHLFIGGIYWVMRKIIGPIVRFIFVRNVRGIDHIPLSGAAILAFNHQSFFDFISFAAVSPRNIHFLSAEKFFDHPVWKILMILTGQIKVNRHDHNKFETHQAVKNHVEKGTLIGIFPEGTRSPYRDEMLKAFTGAAKFALEHRLPIIPVGIVGSYDVMSKHDQSVKWKKIIEINVGSPLIFPEHHDRYGDNNSCVFVIETVMREIEKLSGKKYPFYESR